MHGAGLLNNVCVPCTSGNFAPIGTTQSCQACATGSYALALATVCINCALGGIFTCGPLTADAISWLVELIVSKGKTYIHLSFLLSYF